MRAVLAELAVNDELAPQVFAVVDKFERQPRDVSREKLEAIGMTATDVDALFDLLDDGTLDHIEQRFGQSAEVAALLSNMRRYFDYLEALGILEWVTVDLKIVRGLAYYTGIVFELFDAKGELRAICGGGRYDNLLMSLGGVDLPALGFGMGDVVLGELLRDRKLLPALVATPDVWVASDSPALDRDVRRAATALRSVGVSVEYALREQTLMKQVKAAKSAGALRVLTLHDPAVQPERHSWSTRDVPPEWDRLLADIGL
jgi:histidyl-tRNA synthetase